jgi:hypothetical protein
VGTTSDPKTSFPPGENARRHGAELPAGLGDRGRAHGVVDLLPTRLVLATRLLP